MNGTVNDLAVSGARPLALTLSLVLEEGLAADDLRAEVEAAARAAEEAGVAIVGGDTKVVERGRCDSLYVTTTGIGRLDPRASLSPASLRPGDRILVSGTIGDHGTAIMLARGEFELEGELASDTRSLWPAVDALLDAGRRRRSPPARRHARRSRHGPQRARALVRGRDPRPRGCRPGPACRRSGVRDPRHRPDVRRERGQARRSVAPASADAALAALRSVPGGEHAAEVGEVRDDPQALVIAETGFGGRRVVDMLVGDPLPRIC